MAKVLSDPGFYVDLDLPDLSRPDVIEHSAVADDVFVRLRYMYIGDLDPIVHRLLGHQPLSWIQELRIDTRKTSGTLGYAAERNPKLSMGRRVLSSKPTGTRRSVTSRGSSWCT